MTAHCIESLEKKFSDQIKKMETHKMQGMPMFLIIRPIEDSEKISSKDQKLF